MKDTNYKERNDMKMLFADTLKKLRTEKGFSQKEIAKRMYVTNSTVSRWESGIRLPDVAMI
jgi:transcriptional regulator with XRE-family HTH domain